MQADYHIHTEFSDDSSERMRDAVERAIELGLEEICFTEHVDHGVKTDTNCNYDAYYAELCRCRKDYAGRIEMKLGIEFGVQTHTVAQFQQDFTRLPFDFVLLSCHQVEDKEFWNGEYQRGRTQDEVNQGYYNELLAVVQQYENYSVLAHLDMVRRYDNWGDYPFERVRGTVEQILLHVIAGGKGIELNTSCYRYKLPDLTPSREILSMYRELGGEIITLGSDAHNKGALAYQFATAREELKKLGFTRHCTFKAMQPVFHDL